MANAAQPPSTRTFMCAAVFLDIVEYSKTPVVRQLVIKNRFNEIVAKGLENVASADRRHVLPISIKECKNAGIA